MGYFFIIFKNNFIFGCAGSSLLCRLSLVAVNRGCSLVLVHWLLIAVASLVAEYKLYGTRASIVAASGPQSTGSIVVVHGLSCFTACGIFLDQGSNPCLLHWQVDSLPLSHQESPIMGYFQSHQKYHCLQACISDKYVAHGSTYFLFEHHYTFLVFCFLHFIFHCLLVRERLKV